MKSWPAAVRSWINRKEDFKRPYPPKDRRSGSVGGERWNVGTNTGSTDTDTTIPVELPEAVKTLRRIETLRFQIGKLEDKRYREGIPDWENKVKGLKEELKALEEKIKKNEENS